MHTDVERKGEFHSNSTMLNEIHKTVIQTVLSNLQSLPSDVSHCHVAPLFSVDAFISSQHLVRLCEVPIHT
eukprot:COSAG01_NODE_53106_length_341_cov_1.256198_1_plen_70_part_10